MSIHIHYMSIICEVNQQINSVKKVLKQVYFLRNTEFDLIEDVLR